MECLLKKKMLNFLKVFLLIWLSLTTIAKISALPNDYIQFGGNEDESRQAAYYLSADSGTNTGPTDELKRVQRSLLRNLFKNNLFKDCNNCCNNNNGNYNVGNGALPALPLPPFNPWRPKPLWQPLFGAGKCDKNYAPNGYPQANFYNNYPPLSSGYNLNAYQSLPAAPIPNYENNGKPPTEFFNKPNLDNNLNAYNSLPPAPVPSYDNNGDPPTESFNKPPEPVYETLPLPAPEPVPLPLETVNKLDNLENVYGGPNKPLINENPSDLPKPPTGCIENLTSHQKTENPSQLVYQPIIFVSPHSLDKNLTPTKQGLAEGEDEALKTENFLRGHEQSKDANLIIEENKENRTNVLESNEPTVQSSAVISTTPKPEPEQQHHQHQLQQLPSPPISTVASVYNIISPSYPMHSYPTGLLPNVPYSHGVPMKFSLNTLAPTPVYPPVPPQPTAAYAPLPATPRVPAPFIQLTADDQPYRECPELFVDYQRKLSAIMPHNYNGGYAY